MKNIKISNKGQARIFKNPYLEILTKSHPLVIWGMYIPLLSYLVYQGVRTTGYSTLNTVLLFLGGVCFWTFFEYIAHRYVFHLVSRNKTLERFTYILHGNHHEFPRDRQRLFMPAIPSLIISSFLLGLMYLVAGNYSLIFFPGFIFGYLLYASMHYAIHAWKPPFAWLKPLWRNHHLHHYTNEEKGFGVSSMFWDKVFGTTFDLKKYKVDKQKSRELMFTSHASETQPEKLPG
ncbi:MAG: sterol desaturase family protein [Chitinophagaceae bacterium]|jgi:sterol desaturase/sphingolipid hydroxylase (fatty acid hydroxylase superfamily)|nr:sterol desaturase family protein [Chitinophagaceae bacterium]